MSGTLPPEDEALWARVAATVTPLGSPRGHRQRRRLHENPPAVVIPARATPIAGPHAESLDSGWDRRLSRGQAEPQMVIDLHGLTRDAARELLYRRLAEARARSLRVILVITGKGSLQAPAPADLIPGLSGGRAPRGSIRAELPRWLGEAPLSGLVAAVRRAHPRHGGGGAVYLVLKR